MIEAQKDNVAILIVTMDIVTLERDFALSWLIIVEVGSVMAIGVVAVRGCNVFRTHTRNL